MISGIGCPKKKFNFVFWITFFLVGLNKNGFHQCSQNFISIFLDKKSKFRQFWESNRNNSYYNFYCYCPFIVISVKNGRVTETSVFKKFWLLFAKFKNWESNRNFPFLKCFDYSPRNLNSTNVLQVRNSEIPK